jgi:hypothetical protein
MGESFKPWDMRHSIKNMIKNKISCFGFFRQKTKINPNLMTVLLGGYHVLNCIGGEQDL